MAKDVSEIWRHYFRNWPAEVERRGVLVTAFNEQIPFENFSESDDLLLIERRAPDTMGARLIILSYDQVSAVKIVDVVKMRAFQSLGFAQPPAARK